MLRVRQHGFIWRKADLLESRGAQTHGRQTALIGEKNVNGVGKKKLVEDAGQRRRSVQEEPQAGKEFGLLQQVLTTLKTDTQYRHAFFNAVIVGRLKGRLGDRDGPEG